MGGREGSFKLDWKQKSIAGIMAEAEVTRRRKKSSVEATGIPSTGAAPLHTSGSGEERTTRAVWKRAEIDDADRVADPASGIQQAKKRAALASLSNHSSLPSSHNTSPVSEVNLKKRAALGSLSNSANVPATRTLGPGAVKTLSQGGAGKTTAATLSKRVDVETVPVSEKEGVQEKAQGIQSTSVQNNAVVIASLERKALENLYISRNTTALHHELGFSSSSQNFTDIDCDLADPQICSIYAIDIYHHLRKQEVKRRPSTEFMESVQQDITAGTRGILTDWLVEVAEKCKLVSETLYLTVSYIDCFLSNNVVNRQRLELVGVSCMLIAAKHEEIYPPQTEEFCNITDNIYVREEILEMERRVLSNLHFELTTPTTESFLRLFIRAAQAGYAVPALQLEFLGNYLAELTLVEYSFLHYLPSLVAGSAVFLAKFTIDSGTTPWNATLQHYSGYRPSELQDCVRDIHELQLNSKSCTLPAIRAEYSQHKFKCVATWAPSARIPPDYFQDFEASLCRFLFWACFPV